MTKKILIAVGALLVLAVAAVLVVPSFIDWNGYKAQIESEARKATGRDLSIDGDISLALLPAPKLSVEGVRFANAEGGSAPDMATLESLDVRVALMPLLSGKIQVTSLTLVKPTVLLEKLPDGHGNWEIAPAGQAAPAPSEAAHEGGSGTGGLALSFDSVRIENGTFIYRDAAAGSEQKLEALDSEIHVGSLSGPFDATGTATYQGIKARFEANAGALNAGQPATVRLKLGLGDPESTLEFAGMVTTASETGPHLTGKLSAGGNDLSALLKTVSPDSGSNALMKQKFALSADIDAGAQGGSAKNLTLALGDQQATGEATAELGELIKAKLTLSLPGLDLDKLMASAAPAAPADQGQAQQAAAPVPQTRGPSFAIPQNIQADIDLGIEAISYNSGVVNKVRMVAQVANGEMSLTRFNASLPGGSDVALAGKLAAVEGVPSFAGTLELHSDNLRSLLEWLKVAMPAMPPDRLRKLSLSSRVTATPSQLQIAEMDLRFDSSRVAGGVVVALPNGERKVPGLGIGLAIDKINLDAYLPPEAAGSGTGTQPAPTQPATTDNNNQAATQPADAAKAPPSGGLPLDALKPLAGLNANVELKVGSLTMNDQTAKGVHLDATLQGGTLTLRDVSVKDFAGGSGNLSGTVANLATQPTLDSQFNLKVADATRVLQFAGMENPPQKLGKLAFTGKLSGGGQQVAYDIAFDIAGIGANGKATGTASGLGAGIPKVDTDFALTAKNAGPLLEMAGLAGASGAKLGQLDFSGTAKSGDDQITYNAALALAGISGKGSFNGAVSGLTGTPHVDTQIDVSADKPAALLALFGIDGPTAAKLGALSIKGTLKGGADDMALNLALGGLGGSATLQGGIKAMAAPPSFNLVMTANHPEMRQLAAAFAPDAAPGNASLGPLSLSATATGTTQDAKVTDLSLKMGPSDLAGTLDYVAPPDGRPTLTANLTSTMFDISPFVPASKGGGGDANKKNAPAGDRWSKAPLDLSALDTLDADVTAKAQHFVMNDTKIDNLDAHVTLKNGTLVIDKFTGNTYGGAVDLAGTLVGHGTPTFQGRLSGTNLSSSELMGSGLLADRITGPVSVTTDLNAAGASMSEMVSNLNGNGNVNGDITVLSKIEQQVGSVGLNLLGALAQQKLGGVGTQIQGLTQIADTAYRSFTGVPNSLTGDFLIRNGKVTTDNLALANSNARALAQGAADLPAWTLDFLATIFRAPDLNQPFLQLNLNGLLDQPNTKFKAFQGTNASAPAASDLLQQVLPSGTSNSGTQKPANIWQQILPGVLGTGQSGGGSGTGTPAAIPDQTAPEPGSGGLTTAPATTVPDSGSATPPAANDNSTAAPGASGLTNPPATTDTAPAQPDNSAPDSSTEEPTGEPGAGGLGGSSQNNRQPAQPNSALNKVLQGILQPPTQQQQQ
ncbi:MAG TPA: AsmA family protein [Hypericibacter adhaerens]|jgi:uncharacterized protein involved in outer membrane biogenesis|uniref:AsmA family protein n=1 Tax=Hypericibacter adhaerens TaxID=2602016 RepID=UPI002C6A016D|nr:AsmA family protein [Hypericibacter adhaerens]HWA44429.1 AsmA family protein [Hypericibacter adhaerens]